MRRISTFLFSLIIGLSVSAQSTHYLHIENFEDRLVDYSEIARLKQSHTTVQNNNRAAEVSFMMDYDQVDFADADANGYDYTGFIWEQNDNWPQSSSNTLNFSAVLFKALIDSDPNSASYLTEYPYDQSTITIDSISAIFGHVNNSGTNDTIGVSIFAVNSDGTPNYSSVMWDTTLITNVGLSDGLDQNGNPNLLELVLPINLTLGTGEDFGVRLDYVGDTTDNFIVINDYKDECFGTCAATSSIVPLSSWYEINGGTFVGNPTTVVPVLDPSCDAEVRCQEWYLQNFLMRAWVTNSVEFNVVASSPSNEGCSGDFVQIDATATGGQEPLTYAWTPTTNLDDATSGNPQAVVGDDDITYTVVVTDANNETVSGTITVNSRQINVDLPDETLACGATLNYIAGTTGETSGASYSWSNQGSQNFANQIDAAGTYSVTVSNGFGCESSDQGTVSIAGVSQDPTFAVPSPICAGVSNTFTNTTTNTTDWNFTWDFGDNNLAFTLDGTNTYVAAGNYLLSLAATDANNCKFKRFQNVLVLPSGDAACQTTTGIEDAAFAASVNIVPNPSNGLFNINIRGLKSDLEISIIDLTGKSIYNYSAVNTVDMVKEIDLTDISNGLYLVKFQSGDQSMVERITIAR